MATNRLRMIERVIYRLKRDWGLPITIVNETSNAYDLLTGKRIVEKSSFIVRQAILLPTTIHRTFAYDIGYLKANSNFTYGGQFAEGTRQVIVDTKDLGDFEITACDQIYIIFQNERYNLKDVQRYDGNIAYYITMIQVKGELPGNVFNKNVTDQLAVADVAGGTTA